MKNNYTDQALEDFLAGKPNPELRKALEEDADLRERLETHQDVILGIRHFGKSEEQKQIQQAEEELDQAGFFESEEVQEKIEVLGDQALRKNIESAANDLEKEGFFEQQPQNPTRQIRYISRVLLVAASFALLLWAGSQWINFSSEKTNPPLVELFSPYPSQNLLENIEKEQSETGFGGVPNEEALALLNSAIETYQNQNFEQASKQFEHFVQGNPDHIFEPQAQFYRAIAYLGAGQPVQASNLLEQLQGNKNIDQNALHWYLALAYSQSQQSIKALEVIENQEINTPYKQKSATLLKILSETK